MSRQVKPSHASRTFVIPPASTHSKGPSRADIQRFEARRKAERLREEMALRRVLELGY